MNVCIAVVVLQLVNVIEVTHYLLQRGTIMKLLTTMLVSVQGYCPIHCGSCVETRQRWNFVSSWYLKRTFYCTVLMYFETYSANFRFLVESPVRKAILYRLSKSVDTVLVLESSVYFRLYTCVISRGFESLKVTKATFIGISGIRKKSYSKDWNVGVHE